jgi:hypothetical protein
MALSLQYAVFNKEYVMKAGMNAWVAGALVLGMAACGKIGQSNTESYNQLVDKYNALLTTSGDLQKRSVEEESELGGLNLKLENFAAQIESLNSRYLSKNTLTQAESGELKTQVVQVQQTQREIYSSLTDLESALLKQATAINANGANVYKDADFAKSMRDLSRAANGLSESIAGRSRALNGIRKLVDTQVASINQQWNRIQIVAGQPATTLGTPRPSIALTEKDKEVVKSVSSGNAGFVRKGGSVTSLAKESDVTAYAAAQGYQTSAASDAYKIAFAGGGLVSFASDPKEIPQAINDMVAHIKPSLNRNLDDLEIAFVIDYSGSMSDDIDAVVAGLTDIVEGFKNVKVSGRNVKIALVLFGEPGRETVELNLTGDMVKVSNELARIRREFGSRQHSTNPGEASYHGLAITASKVAWTSKNRMAILITDEPSSELQNGETAYVQGVVNALKATGVDTSIYTIVVK